MKFVSFPTVALTPLGLAGPTVRLSANNLARFLLKFSRHVVLLLATIPAVGQFMMSLPLSSWSWLLSLREWACAELIDRVHRSRVRDARVVNDAEGRGSYLSQSLPTASTTWVIPISWPGPHPCTAGGGTDSLWVLCKFPQAGIIWDLLGVA